MMKKRRRRASGTGTSPEHDRGCHSGGLGDCIMVTGEVDGDSGIRRRKRMALVL